VSGWFEDFVVGDRFRHSRGRTVADFDVAVLTLLVMNTADGHFNEHRMSSTPFKRRINFGGLNLALVVGLTTKDTAVHAIAELGLERARFITPVFAGDTVYAATEVVDAQPAPDREDAGIVTFRHWGLNERDEVICEITRMVLIRRRPVVAP
jgi:acyl dehydratase